jgi:hypothetical protein
MVSQQFPSDINSRNGRMNCTTGHEGDDMAETVTGVDNQGSFFLRIFNFVFVTTKICRMGPASKKNETLSMGLKPLRLFGSLHIFKALLSIMSHSNNT